MYIHFVLGQLNAAVDAAFIPDSPGTMQVVRPLSHRLNCSWASCEYDSSSIHLLKGEFLFN